MLTSGHMDMLHKDVLDKKHASDTESLLKKMCSDFKGYVNIYVYHISNELLMRTLDPAIYPPQDPNDFVDVPTNDIYIITSSQISLPVFPTATMLWASSSK